MMRDTEKDQVGGTQGMAGAEIALSEDESPDRGHEYPPGPEAYSASTVLRMVTACEIGSQPAPRGAITPIIGGSIRAIGDETPDQSCGTFGLPLGAGPAGGVL